MALIRAALGGACALAALTVVHAAELPSRKAKSPEAAHAQTKCNVAGMAGVLAANGVCVRLSGSISASVGGPVR